MKLKLNQGDRSVRLSTLVPPSSVDVGSRSSAASVRLAPSGSYSAGQSAYDNGIGFWLGLVGGVPKLSIGNSSGNKLTWSGSSLAITGTITATSGTIGGWTIGATALTSGSGATTVGLDSGGTNPAIYAGSTTPASAPFRVTNAGAVTASNATIAGSITASALTVTSGNITMSGSTDILMNTSDGSDNQRLQICGGGAFGISRGATLTLGGNENAFDPGDFIAQCGSIAGATASIGASGCSFEAANTGVATINATDINLTCTDEITLGDGTTNSIIFVPATMTWSGNPTHSGNHTFSGNVTVNGNCTLGNSSGDAHTFTGSVAFNDGITVTGNIFCNSSSNTIGYSSGAGGSVTQLTSKSTGVTLNKPCGQITMDNATLNAGAQVAFVVTCDQVTGGDIPVVCISGGAAIKSAYQISVTDVGTGVFTIAVANVSGSNLSEALVINYAVINAVTS